jgi:signal transduction histidine kinase
MYYGLAIVISSVFLHDQSLSSQSPFSVGLALALLFVFQPIKKFFDRLTNRIFYRDYYNADELFARFNKLLTSTTNLRTLLEKASLEISATLKSEQVFGFIHGLHGRYLTAGTEHHKILSKDEISALESYLKRSSSQSSDHSSQQAANQVVSQTGNYSQSSSHEVVGLHNVLVTKLLEEEDVIYRLLTKHRIDLVIPLVRDGTIGYLFLGSHKTSRYTSRDLKVLRTIADELVIAIENALSIEEVKEVNAANLKHRIDSAVRELSASNAVLRQMDAEKNEFVSIASHELRTPMTVIGGYINLLQREQIGKLTKQQQDALNKMSINTRMLIKLVNDMLDLSKLEAGRLEMKPSNQPLAELMTSIIDKIKPGYEAKNITLSFQNQTADGTKLYTDPEKFERIMMNLLSNAQKFTNQGGKVIVKVAIDQPSHMAIISVIDNGIGIEPKAMQNLFKKFSQVDDYLQRDTGGTGLGLAISRQLVEKLGGAIFVESTAGKGSTFWFTAKVG